MHSFRNIYGRLSRITCFLFAIHIFNLSINPSDKEPDFAPEDLSINYIESVTEFLAEVVFGFTNAFEEYDEHDEGSGALDFCKDFYITEAPFAIRCTTIKEASPQYFIKDTQDQISLTSEITSPPPKA